MRNALRMKQVQDPVIPIVGDWVRSCPGTISLGQGVVHYGPPPSAIDQIQNFLSNPENHKYHAVEGIPLLYDKIREKLQIQNNISIEPKANRDEGESVLCVTAGGNMAFVNAVVAATDPGDEVILLAPFYFNHEMAIRMADCIPVGVMTDENYQPDLDALRRAISTRTRALVTVSPNNPTGAVYLETTLRAINQLCKENGLYHIHDEAYEYFTYDGARHFSPGSIGGACSHTISLFSLSKAYGFASWRIGYMVYPVHLDVAIKKVQDTILICPPIISQYAAYGALQAGSSYCRGYLQEKSEVRSIMLEELDRLRNVCRVVHSQGAFYLFAAVDLDMDDLLVAERLIREHGIAVMPGYSFGVKGIHSFRISYGALRKDAAVEGIRRLTRGLQKLAGA